MRKLLAAAAVVVGLTAGTVATFAEGDLAGAPINELQLAIGTTPGEAPTISANEFQLVTGKYYRLNIAKTGEPDWRLDVSDLLLNSHLRVVSINGIEVHLQGMAFRAIEFDEPGKASFSFTPIKTGTFPFTVTLPPAAAKPDDGKRVAGRFVVK